MVDHQIAAQLQPVVSSGNEPLRMPHITVDLPKTARGRILLLHSFIIDLVKYANS